MERIQKIIAQSGLCSRRKAEELITSGKVEVNGTVVTELGTKVGKFAKITVDGKPIVRENKVYFIMNKPKSTLSSVSDDRNRKTVVDLVECDERIFPVGRLDYDTTGVLILTNDGEFANDIIHPSSMIGKTYEATVEGIIKAEEIKELERGVILDDGFKTAPCKAWITKKNFDRNWTQIEITIHEGKNRQVKRMMEAIGHKVTRLHRKMFGYLEVKDLKPGEYRILKPFEVKQLRELANKKK